MKYIILGIIQGFTEFLPISSSAHLLWAQNIMHLNKGILEIIAFAHLGTLLALLVYFFKDIRQTLKSWRLIGYILCVTFVTGLLGILFKKFFESLFFVGIIKFTLLINGAIIIYSYFSYKPLKKISSLNLKDMLRLGFVQALAIIPGISRSGITISYFLLKRLNIKDAFKFSFLAGMPAILGGFILEADFSHLSDLRLTSLFICLGASFLSGIFALMVLKRLMYNAKFYYFGYYCILVGLILFFVKI